MIGRQISRYRIVERIGSGGMGVVYKAMDTELERYVALKFLPAEAVSDPLELERFLHEARAAASLNHPNICTIYEVNGNPPEPFIAMEFLAGQSLRERIGGQSLPEELILDIAIQAADGLSAAHSRHIVHRDIKPANIFVTQSDQVKILDFGLAKLSNTSGPDDETTLVGNESTGIASTAGTIFYMSPEQARGEDVDARSDIFSFGTVLYEMATGRQAFQGSTPAIVYNAILNLDPTPIDQLRPGLAPELVRIIAKCLEKNRDRRYSGAAGLRSELKRLRTDSDSRLRGLETPPGKPFARGRSKGLVAGVSVFGLVALAAVTAMWVPRLRGNNAMKETDVILLADFVNTTGDSMFDGTLKQALALKLEESPFLNVFPEQRVRETLTYMRRAPNEKLTPETGREVCQRQNLKAMLNGEIAPLGSQFVLTLNAVDCATGNVLARDQVQAASKEDVLKAVGDSAMHMRKKLGESLPMIERMNAPIDQVTTSSLEALKAFSAGEALRASGAEMESMPLYRHAIEVDPLFTLAYARLGVINSNAGRREEARKFISKAYELRDRVSERERFYATAHYQRIVENDNEKAVTTYKLWRQTYPRDYIPPVNLGNIYLATGRTREAAEQLEQSLTLYPSPTAYANLAAAYASLGESDKFLVTCKTWSEKVPADGSPHQQLSRYYAVIGQYDQSLAEAQKALELEPTPLHYVTLVQAYLALNRLDDAQAAIDKAIAEKNEQPDLHYYQFLIAWYRSNDAPLKRAVDWLKTSEYSAFLYGIQGLTAASEGRLVEAQKLFKQAQEVGSKEGLHDEIERFGTSAAFVYNAFGDQSRALSLIRESLNGTHTRSVLSDAATIFASSGNESAMESALAELSAKYPDDAYLKKVSIPCMRALFDLQRNLPSEALNRFRNTAPYEDLDVHYLRGRAYAQSGRHSEAIQEFQYIVDHYGLALGSGHTTFRMAHLQLARSYAAAGDTDKAKQTYETFLKFWKNPDPDIPLLKEARSEYARIRAS